MQNLMSCSLVAVWLKIFLIASLFRVLGGWVTGGYKIQIRYQAAAEKEKLKWCSELQGVHRLSAGSQALVSKFFMHVY
jgi:hypothetical protein